jgi:hypothetical protein
MQPVVRIFFTIHEINNKDNSKNLRLIIFLRIFLLIDIKGINRANIRKVLFRKAKIENNDIK